MDKIQIPKVLENILISKGLFTDIQGLSLKITIFFFHKDKKTKIINKNDC